MSIAAEGSFRFRVRRNRAFDPAAVGRLECDAWVAYYRRDWLAFARSAVILSRRVFGLSWPATVLCSWLILRATQLWAPTHENDPYRAQRAMERFYRIAQRRYGESFDPAKAAALELDWWRIHRANQRLGVSGEDQALADALARLYAHIYGVPCGAMRRAAEQRALAMRLSDQWNREGCLRDSPLIEQERAVLIRSHTALLGAVAERPNPSEQAPEPRSQQTAAFGIDRQKLYKRLTNHAQIGIVVEILKILSEREPDDGKGADPHYRSP